MHTCLISPPCPGCLHLVCVWSAFPFVLRQFVSLCPASCQVLPRLGFLRKLAVPLRECLAFPFWPSLRPFCFLCICSSLLCVFFFIFASSFRGDFCFYFATTLIACVLFVFHRNTFKKYILFFVWETRKRYSMCSSGSSPRKIHLTGWTVNWIQKPMQGRRKSAARHFGGKAHVSLKTITVARFFIPVNNDWDSEPTRTIQEPGIPVTYQNVRWQKTPSWRPGKSFVHF